MRTVLWAGPFLHSVEYFTLIPQTNGFGLNGTINLVLEGEPTQVVYRIDCDLDWKTRRVEVQQRRPDDDKHLILTVDNAQNWRQDGIIIPWATGLTDIDLSITPATNMLPIRQHQLQNGESCEVNCVWVQPPALTLSTLLQRYTRIDAHHYDYAAPSLNFQAVLSVDADGIIIQYGDLWHQPGIS